MQKAKVCFKQPEEKAEALCRQVKLYKVTLLEQRQDRSTHIQGPEKTLATVCWSVWLPLL